MSSPDTTTEEVTAEDVGGLDEVLPEPLQPLWRPIDRFQEFRRAYSSTYITVMEAIIAVVLIGGYLWWLYIFVVM